MNKVDKAVVSVFIVGAVFLLGVMVPVATTHEQNVQICNVGTCQPCSSHDSLFSLLFGFPPVSTNCQHTEVTPFNSTTHSA